MKNAPGPRAGRMTLACLILAATAGAARAEVSPWYLGVSQNFTHDSNVLNLPDTLTLPAPYSRSDTISSTSLLGGLDQQWGRQHLGATAAVRSNRFQHNTQRNNTGYSLNANLDWETVERLSGRISASSDQSLAQLTGTADQSVTLRNIVRTDQLDAVARLGTVTRLTLEAGVGYRQIDYSLQLYDRFDNRQTYGSLGVRWRTSPALQLGAALRLTNGRYPHFPASSGGYNPDTYRRTDIDLTANWNPSGATSVSARLSPTQTRYDRDTARNLSAPTGMVQADWQPGGRLRLSANLSRDNGQSSDTFNVRLANQILPGGVNDYGRVTTALRLSANYDLSAKLALNASASQAHRNLVNTSFFQDTLVSRTAGSDTTSTLSLGARWTPLRWALVGCDLSQEQRRTSSALSWSYSSTSLGCYGQVTLQ